MTYPRACPSCGAREPSPEQLYSTRAAFDGGTPSPWLPDSPGRVLDLRCSACWALIRWDYFGSELVGILGEGRSGAGSDSAGGGTGPQPLADGLSDA
jgi:hypothetical protein